jgi:UDP-glucose-4-epimerase GalE
MNVLVVGGAGYIGGHTVRALRAAGHRTLIFDNFSTGHRDLAIGDVAEGDLADAGAIRGALDRFRPDAVMHFSASCYVGESVSRPAAYYRNNVANALTLLDAMRDAGVGRFVFSSSAATYGNPVRTPMDEAHPQAPINPYGWTKRIVEQMLADFAPAYGLRSVALRYFNAAGASADAALGERHAPETHLIPRAVQAVLGLAPPVDVFGADYPTRDGTCVRDYVHVEDLADAHLRALAAMDGGPAAARAFNLGIGRGFTVREVLDAVARAAGRPVPRRDAPRRPGDPPELVADAAKARRDLGWTPRFVSLDAIVETAWRWHVKDAGRARRA